MPLFWDGFFALKPYHTLYKTDKKHGGFYLLLFPIENHCKWQTIGKTKQVKKKPRGKNIINYQRFNRRHVSPFIVKCRFLRSSFPVWPSERKSAEESESRKTEEAYAGARAHRRRCGRQMHRQQLCIRWKMSFYFCSSTLLPLQRSIASHREAHKASPTLRSIQLGPVKIVVIDCLTVKHGGVAKHGAIFRGPHAVCVPRHAWFMSHLWTSLFASFGPCVSRRRAEDAATCLDPVGWCCCMSKSLKLQVPVLRSSRSAVLAQTEG